MEHPETGAIFFISATHRNSQAPSAAGGIAIPPVTAAEPAAEPEPTEAAAEAAGSAAEDAEAAEAEVEVVDLEDGERSPGSPAEVRWIFLGIFDGILW